MQLEHKPVWVSGAEHELISQSSAPAPPCGPSPARCAPSTPPAPLPARQGQPSPEAGKKEVSLPAPKPAAAEHNRADNYTR